MTDMVKSPIAIPNSSRGLEIARKASESASRVGILPHDVRLLRPLTVL